MRCEDDGSAASRSMEEQQQDIVHRMAVEEAGPCCWSHSVLLPICRQDLAATSRSVVEQHHNIIQ